MSKTITETVYTLTDAAAEIAQLKSKLAIQKSWLHSKQHDIEHHIVQNNMLKTKIDNLKSKFERCKSWLASEQSAVYYQATENKALRTEIDRLKLDRERLDWLEKNWKQN